MVFCGFFVQPWISPEFGVYDPARIAASATTRQVFQICNGPPSIASHRLSASFSAIPVIGARHWRISLAYFIGVLQRPSEPGKTSRWVVSAHSPLFAGRGRNIQHNRQHARRIRSSIKCEKIRVKTESATITVLPPWFGWKPKISTCKAKTLQLS